MTAPAERPALVVTLSLLAALSATAVDIALPAHPAIATAFGAAPEAGGVIVSAYFAGYGPGQLLWGPLADRFGRMRPLLAGLTGFVLSTVACTFAGSLGTLALLRVLQGAFAGSGPVIARAIARDRGGGARTARLLATIAIIFGAAPLLAPLLGSLLLCIGGWRTQLWFVAALGIALIAASCAFVAPAARATPTEALPMRAFPATVRTLLRTRAFVAGTGVVCALVFGYATLLSTGAAMAEARYGVTETAFGPLFALAAAAVMLGAALSRRALRVRTAQAALRRGAAISGAAALALLVLAPRAVPLAVLWSAVFCYVLGFGAVMPLANALALEPAGRAAGIASALLGALSSLAASAGSALASSSLFGSAYAAVCVLMGAGGLCACAIAQAFRGHPRRGAAPQRGASQRSTASTTRSGPIRS